MSSITIRRTVFAGVSLAIALGCARASMASMITEPVIKDGNKGWQRDANGKVKLKIWMGGLTDLQKDLIRKALSQWTDYKNYYAEPPYPDMWKKNFVPRAGSLPENTNQDVMAGGENDEGLPTGTKGRNLSPTDRKGMDQLYGSATFEVTDASSEGQANLVFKKGNQNYGEFESEEGVIVKGSVEFSGDEDWFYGEDDHPASPSPDGKITNEDKKGKFQLGSDGSLTPDSDIPSSCLDFYSVVKHEIGHALGFGHSIPEPASAVLLLAGLPLLHRRRRSSGG